MDACHVRGGRRVLVYSGRIDMELADDDCKRGDVCSDDGDHRDEAISEVKCALVGVVAWGWFADFRDLALTKRRSGMASAEVTTAKASATPS